MHSSATPLRIRDRRRRPGGGRRGARPPRRRREARERRERGSTAAELAVATPLLMLLLLTIVQFAVWEHGVHVARATASQALEAARDAGGSPAAGQTEAARLLGQIGGVLRDPNVTVTDDGQTVRVTIDATAQTVVPGLNLHIHTTLAGSREIFRAPAAGTAP